MTGQSQSLRSKIVTSAKLSSLRFASDIGLRLLSTVVLTRLLAPEIYGVFAVVLVYLYILEMCSDLGLRSLIVTLENEPDETFLSTCWTVSILRGVLIVLVSVSLAGLLFWLQSIGAFAAETPYADPVLPLTLLALGFSAWLYGFETPRRFVNERSMRFGWVTTVDVVRNVITLLVTIALAYYLRSVWALVLGNFVRSGLHVAFGFAVFRGPAPRLSLNRQALSLVIARGKWILGHSTLTALTMSADRIFLGAVMTSSTFGFYYIARQLVDILPKFLESLNAQMGMQVFTQLHQRNADNFRRQYYRYRVIFDAAAAIGAGALIVLAPLLVDIIFDDRYLGIAPIVQIIALATVLTGPLILRSVFNAAREFRETTFFSLISLAVLWLGLFVAVWGFGSETAALFVIALFRLPELVVMTSLGWRRGWVTPWREFLPVLFLGLGWMLGSGIAMLAEPLL
ncbi:MAG: oligosaccharide flippase family protein [Pseudomonadota bacterium]